MTVQLVRAGQAGEGEAEPNPTGQAGGFGRDVLVTRPACATGGTDQASEVLPAVFCDWVTISQIHPAGGLPFVDAGVVWSADADGAVEWRSVRRVKHEGSYETSLQLRCDGFRVELSGNLSRFGRVDNVWGFALLDCVARANRVLAGYGLPPFTAGECVQRANGRGCLVTEWTGARISRLDLTTNFEAGSSEAAHLVLQYLGTQHIGRKSGRVLGGGETVDWGAGSRRNYWKAYIKHLELKRHGCADTRLIEYCEASGLVRLEGTFRSNCLTDLQACWLGEWERGWAMGQLMRLFDEHVAAMSRAERSTDDLDELPRHLRATARDYLAGMDMSAVLSRRSFYRHREALLGYGLDIAVRNVSPFRPRVRVVELVRATAPDWYQLAA